MNLDKSERQATTEADVRQLRVENAWLRERDAEMVRAAESFRATVIAEVVEAVAAALRAGESHHEFPVWERAAEFIEREFGVGD